MSPFQFGFEPSKCPSASTDTSVRSKKKKKQKNSKKKVRRRTERRRQQQRRGKFQRASVIGSAEALPILCVRCARRERERERYRERERERERVRRKWRHLSSAEIGDEFWTFPCQKFAPYYWRKRLHFSLPKLCTFASSLFKGAEFIHTSCCQKRCTLRNSSPSSFCFCQIAWQGIEAPITKQTIDFPAAPSFFSSKKWIKLKTKTIGNRKKDCAWGCARGINTTWENLQIEKHKSVRWAERTPSWFVLFDLQIFSGGVYPPSATSRTISFSISNSFWY